MPGKCFMKYSCSWRFLLNRSERLSPRSQSVAGSAPDRANNGIHPLFRKIGNGGQKTTGRPRNSRRVGSAGDGGSGRPMIPSQISLMPGLAVNCR